MYILCIEREREEVEEAQRRILESLVSIDPDGKAAGLRTRMREKRKKKSEKERTMRKHNTAECFERGKKVLGKESRRRDSPSSPGPFFPGQYYFFPSHPFHFFSPFAFTLVHAIIDLLG